jgi:hypothetical protein
MLQIELQSGEAKKRRDGWKAKGGVIEVNPVSKLG